MNVGNGDKVFAYKVELLHVWSLDRVIVLRLQVFVLEGSHDQNDIMQSRVPDIKRILHSYMAQPVTGTIVKSMSSTMDTMEYGTPGMYMSLNAVGRLLSNI